MKFRTSSILLLFIVLCGTLTATTRAFSSNLSADLGCAGWSNGSGMVTWDRDTTGSGTEIVNVVAMDGAGNLIYNFPSDFPVGFSTSLGVSVGWMAAPQYNPLRFMLISPAGNGFGEQRYLIATGTCPGLPTYGTEAGQEPIAGPPADNLYDGRINNSQTKDVAAPIAVYCTEQDTLAIFKIDAETGAGTQIINQPFLTETPAENQLLDSANDVNLYLLATGEYQVNAPNFEGKLYSITWIGCDSGTLVHLGA